MDKVQYYDILHWNANGSLMRWSTRRGGSKSWFMNPDGTGLYLSRHLTDSIGESFWSVKDPELLFFSKSLADRSVVYTINIRTGQKKEAATLGLSGYKMVPPHPDEKYFLVYLNSATLPIIRSVG